MAVDWEERRSGWKKRDSDARSNWDVDYARVIHSASFRRLQGKTQILNLGDSDFYRTRLTHSLEVAQIAAGVTRQIELDNESHDALKFLPQLPLIQTIACCHDLGHPPFGHGGEVALNYCMRGNGGFEGNGQTLRILSRLEKFSEADGANLTRRTLLGTLKYPVCFTEVNGTEMQPRLTKGTSTVQLIDRNTSKPPKCYMQSEADVVDWVLHGLSPADQERFCVFKEIEGGKKHGKSQHKSLDCSIMDLADDISYGIHDFEDVLSLGLITREDFEEFVSPTDCASYLDYLKGRYSAEYENDVYSKFLGQLFGESQERKHAISRLVGFFIGCAEILELLEFDEPLLKYRVGQKEGAGVFLEALKKLVREVVIFSPEVQHLEFKGQQMVVAVFETLASEPKAFLPKDRYQAFESSGGDPRVICDFVAGMTDSFLMKTYERLFSPRFGSVFDKL